ncbi:hypothetical protein GPALN_001916 [Globodera pallida]|nr:hypothetical protein GPALN_001916 [Globodera pallida]
MNGLESSDSQSETSEHSGDQVRVNQEPGSDPVEAHQQVSKKCSEKERTFCLPFGCPLGSRCPFKENAVQAWNITKDMADQRDEVLRLKNEIIQLKNINDENKRYIEALRASEEIVKRNSELQQEELLQKCQEIVSLRLQIGQITKAARAQLAIHPAVQSLPLSMTVNATAPAPTAQSIPSSSVITIQPTEQLLSLSPTMSPVPLSPPTTAPAPTAQSIPSSSVITIQPTEQLLSLSPTMSPVPLSPPTTAPAPTAQSPSSSVITQPTEQPLSLSPTMPPPLIATALAPTQQSLPSSSLTAIAIHPTKRKKLMLFAASILNSIFFEELNRQLPIEDITELVILEKQQFSIDEVVKIINQEKVPKLAILRISKKLGVSKSRATLIYTESKRKTATEHQAKATGKRKRELSDGEDDDGGSNKARFPSKQKCQNPKALMPWRPYRKVLPPDMRNSVLSCEDHRNYVAILQNMLKSDPTFRFEHDMKKIKAWDEMLNEERQLYLDTALRTIKSWNTYPNSLFVYPEAPSLNSVMNHHIMKSRCLIGERAFQGVLLEIPWTNAEQQQSVAFRFNVSVLRPGHGKSLKIPDTRQRFMIKLNHRDIEKKISAKLKQKLPITADIDLRNFAIQNDIEVVMDGSTLSHFLSAPYGHKPQISYACRVSVELEFRGGKMRRVCSVFPPMIASRMHRPFVAREYFKWAIKLRLRDDSEQKKDDEKGQKKFKMDESAESLLNELQLGEIGKTAGSSSAGVGKRYAIVTFNGDQQSEFDQHRVLIRTGVHGTEDTRVVSLAVRPEFLPEIAAEKISAEETLMDVVTATLKGSQEHITLRVHFDEQVHQLHLMQIDRKNASDLSRLSQESRKLLSSRIQRLCSLLDALRELNAGEYLLIHDDETVRLVQERNVRQSKKERDSDNESDELNLFIEDEGEENAESDVLSSGPVYDFAWFEHAAKMKPVFTHAPIEDYWNGIDPHYPLQWHIVRGQIPGALFPRNQRI